MGTPPAAGWMSSPDSDGMQRWWDGAGWTSFTRPTPTTTPADVPAQRTGPALPTDPSEQLEKASEALAALQQQGGIFGALAAVASQAVQSQLPAPIPTGPGLQPYGRPAFGNPVSSSGSRDDDHVGTSVSWNVGPFHGGTEPDDRFGNRRSRGRSTGPVGQLVFGLLFVVVGLVVATMITSDNSAHAGETTTRASVVAQDVAVDSDGSRTCSPVAEFSVGGATYRAGSHFSSSSCPAVGSSVTVIYTTSAPGDGAARVQGAGAVLWLVWLFPVVGLGLVVFAIRRLGVVARSLRVLFPSRGL